MPKEWKSKDIAEKWKKVETFRDIVFKSLETIRKEKCIGSSLGANVTATLHSDHKAELPDIDWAEICIVSKFTPVGFKLKVLSPVILCLAVINNMVELSFCTKKQVPIGNTFWTPSTVLKPTNK